MMQDMSEYGVYLDVDLNITLLASSAYSDPDLFQLISDCLQLQAIPSKDEIITDLLVHGRQSLKKYHAVLSPNVLMHAMSGQELLNLLKKNVIETWETILLNQPRIKMLHDTIKTRNSDLFNKIVEGVAEKGNRHKDQPSQIAFLVLQLSFPYLINQTEVLDQLWYSITTDGIESLRNFSHYIAPDDLNLQLNYEQGETPLYLALKVYYKVKGAELLQKNDIFDAGDLHDFAADAFTQIGWISGAKTIGSKIAPFLYDKLLQSILEKIATDTPTVKSDEQGT
jgi:hypothetical protein